MGELMRSALALLAMLSYASAQEHHHPPQDVAMHDRFYSSWDRPDMPGVSCCNKEDCYPTEAKFERGSWYAKQRENGEWMKVPPEKIERNRDAPDARAHVCASKWGYVYCFISAAGG